MINQASPVTIPVFPPPSATGPRQVRLGALPFDPRAPRLGHRGLAGDEALRWHRGAKGLGWWGGRPATDRFYIYYIGNL